MITRRLFIGGSLATIFPISLLASQPQPHDFCVGAQVNSGIVWEHHEVVCMDGEITRYIDNRVVQDNAIDFSIREDQLCVTFKGISSEWWMTI